MDPPGHFHAVVFSAMPILGLPVPYTSSGQFLLFPASLGQGTPVVSGALPETPSPDMRSLLPLGGMVPILGGQVCFPGNQGAGRVPGTAASSIWQATVIPQVFRGIFRASDGDTSVNQALSLAEGSLCHQSQPPAILTHKPPLEARPPVRKLHWVPGTKAVAPLWATEATGEKSE